MISVCMATYNGAKYIKEQLDSILCQLKYDDELIVSDDNSTDNTLEILEQYKDDRIKVFNNTNRKGVVGNFENALNKASGVYIFLSDQDDIWLANKVEICLKELQTVDLVITDCVVVDENLNVLERSYFRYNNSSKGFLKNLYKSSYLGCCLAFRKDILRNIILPIPKSLFLYHDWWISFFAELLITKKFIQEPLMLFRRHSSNVSPTIKKSTLSLYQKVYFRLQLIILGSKRYFKIMLKRVCYKRYFGFLQHFF